MSLPSDASAGGLARRAGRLRRWWPAAALALLDLVLGAWWIGGRGSPFDAAPEPQRLAAQIEPGRIRVVEARSSPAGPAGTAPVPDADVPAPVLPPPATPPASAPALPPVPAAPPATAPPAVLPPATNGVPRCAPPRR